jgi:sec-independent protein translocase protein TatA
MDFFANPLHLVLLIVVIVLLFGANKLGDVGGALGKSIREFKKEAGKDDPPRPAATTLPTAGYVPPPMQSSTLPQPPAAPPQGYTPTDYRPGGQPQNPPPAAPATPPEYTGR